MFVILLVGRVRLNLLSLCPHDGLSMGMWVPGGAFDCDRDWLSPECIWLSGPLGCLSAPWYEWVSMIMYLYSTVGVGRLCVFVTPALCSQELEPRGRVCPELQMTLCFCHAGIEQDAQAFSGLISVGGRLTWTPRRTWFFLTPFSLPSSALLTQSSRVE